MVVVQRWLGHVDQMQENALELDERDNLVFVGRTNSRNPCLRLL